MKQISEIQKKIEAARRELDEAFLRKDEFVFYYEKSIQLDKLIEEYVECIEMLGA